MVNWWILSALLLALLAVNLRLIVVLFQKIQRVQRTVDLIAHQLERFAEEELPNSWYQTQAFEDLRRELGISLDARATRGWAASPDFLLLIARHARATQPRIVVECGSGTSTVVLAKCIEANGAGHVFALEHNSNFAQSTRAHLLRFGLSEWATVIDAPLEPQTIDGKVWNWYASENLPGGPIDLLIVDGPPRRTGALARYPAGPRLFSKLNSPAAVFVDDAVRPDERECIALWLKEFPLLKSTDYACEKGCALLTTGPEPAARAGAGWFLPKSGESGRG